MDGGTILFGGSVAVLAIIGIVRFLFTDTKATTTLEAEIKGLRADLGDEREARRRDAADFNQKIGQLEGLYNEQRNRAHFVINELTRARMLLELVADRSASCTCGALEGLGDMINRSIRESAPIPPPT